MLILLTLLLFLYFTLTRQGHWFLTLIIAFLTLFFFPAALVLLLVALIFTRNDPHASTSPYI